MRKLEKTGTLEIEEDLKYQRRFWRAQRAGWILMALVIAAAIIGVFGPGVFGKSRLGGGPLTVEYDRTLRMNKVFSLIVDARGEGPGEQKLYISAPLVNALAIEEIIPQPERVESALGYYVFVFNKSDEGNLRASFYFKPAAPGRLGGTISIDGAEPLKISQFVYP